MLCHDSWNTTEQIDKTLLPTARVGETGSSCYTGKLLRLRFLKNRKTAGVVLCRIKSISYQLCMRNLEMIDGNKKKLWPKNDFYLSE